MTHSDPLFVIRRHVGRGLGQPGGTTLDSGFDIRWAEGEPESSSLVPGSVTGVTTGPPNDIKKHGFDGSAFFPNYSLIALKNV